jgi:hypothetical protein
MKVVIYANVPKDWRDRIRTPYGIAQFRSYISRNFITSDQPYGHPSKKAVVGDIIIWAFKEGETWYLLGDGFVCYKAKGEGKSWNFWIEGARLYPRSVLLSEVSFAAKTIALNVGFAIDWNQYEELIEKAGTPLVEI